MEVKSDYFEIFYDLLYETYLTNQYNGVMPEKSRGTRSPILWVHVPKGMQQSPAVKLFEGSITSDPLYFHLKSKKIKGGIPGIVDNLAFFNALTYINLFHYYYVPSDAKAWKKLRWPQKLDALFEAFDQCYVKKIAPSNTKTLPIVPTNIKVEITEEETPFALLTEIADFGNKLAHTRQVHLFRTFKNKILDIFNSIEDNHPIVSALRITQIIDSVIVDSKTDELSIDWGNGIPMFLEHRTAFYHFLIDENQTIERRLKALKLLTHLKGLSDIEIVRLIKCEENKVIFDAIDSIKRLIDDSNNIPEIIKGISQFSLDANDRILQEKIIERILKLDFEFGIFHVENFIPHKHFNHAFAISKILIRIIKKRGSYITSDEVLEQTEKVAKICYDNAAHDFDRGWAGIALNVVKDLIQSHKKNKDAL
jgi:hypothetical protein